MSNAHLKAIISATDKLSPVLKNISRAMRSTKKAVSEIGNAGAQLRDTLSGIVAPLGAVVGLGAAAGFGGLVGKVVQTSAQFEKFQTILETIEGSSEKAKASMSWVSDFATKTPYELQEVTDAFVKLKGYGIDPQAGALMAAGDAAAGMGKPLEQAVEALADAMTGENERLKEFQITSKKVGDDIVYFWRHNGKDIATRVKASNKAAIEATITGIWNTKYAGAGEKLSRTWDGLMSNLKDSAAQFMLAIGDAGLFGFLKNELGGLLEKLKGMSNDGSLKALATTISDELVSAFKELKAWVDSVKWKEVWQDIKDVATGIKSFVEAMGGLKGVAMAFAAVLAASVLAPVALAIMAVGRLAITFGTLAGAALAPIAPLQKMTTGLAGAELRAAKLTSALGKLGAAGGVLAAASTGWAIGSALNDYVINPIVEKLTGNEGETLGTWLYDKLNPEEQKPSAANQARPSVLRQMAGAQSKAVVNGALDIRFENAPAGMRIGSGKTNHPGLALNPDVGYSSNALVGAY